MPTFIAGQKQDEKRVQTCFLNNNGTMNEAHIMSEKAINATEKVWWHYVIFTMQDDFPMEHHHSMELYSK